MHQAFRLPKPGLLMVEVSHSKYPCSRRSSHIPIFEQHSETIFQRLTSTPHPSYARAAFQTMTQTGNLPPYEKESTVQAQHTHDEMVSNAEKCTSTAVTAQDQGTVHLIKLRLCKTGKVNNRNIMMAEGHIEELDDAILLPSNPTYKDLMSRVCARAESRSLIDMNTTWDRAHSIYRATVILKLNQPVRRSIPIDEGNWEAVWHLLGRQDANLDFVFMQIEKPRTTVDLTHRPKGPTVDLRKA